MTLDKYELAAELEPYSYAVYYTREGHYITHKMLFESEQEARGFAGQFHGDPNCELKLVFVEVRVLDIDN